MHGTELIKTAVMKLYCLTYEKEMDFVFRGCIVAMLGFLQAYDGMKMNWTQASQHVAYLAGGRNTKYMAQRIREWTWAFLADNQNLPINRWIGIRRSLIWDEDLRLEVHARIQLLNKRFFMANDVLDILNSTEMKQCLHRERDFGKRTAQKWLAAIGY